MIEKATRTECRVPSAKEQTPGVIVPGEIRTYTGVVINILDPKPEQILIEDIAHALSNLCRFNGHTAKFYSVAQHSLDVMELTRDEHKLTALLHDASEAYLVDVPSPIKALLPEYKAIEDKIMRVIAQKFGITYPLPEIVHQADKEWLKHEWENLMVANNWATLDPFDAKFLFLEAFDSLTNID